LEVGPDMGLIVFIWCLVVDAGDLQERRR